VLLANGKIKPFNPEQEHFIQAVQGKVPAIKDIEREFIVFIEEYSELVSSVLYDYDNKRSTKSM
jgi:hypothetical protein